MLYHFLADKICGESTAGLFDKFAIAQVDDGEFLKKHQGQYPVIFISFKDIKEDTFDGALEKLSALISKLYAQHESFLVSDKITPRLKKKFNAYLIEEVSNKPKTLDSALEFLMEFLHKVQGKKVMVLIDEYDSPLTSAYNHGYLNEMSSFMRNLFSAALKSNPYLEKGLMTGIFRVSKNNMLSGLNNLKVRTLLDEHYAGYFGFTESDVNELIEKFNVTDERKDIRDYYNGYCIGSTTIYNPWSMMNYLDEKRLAPYWVLTSNDNVILRKLLSTASNETKESFIQLIQGKAIEGRVETNLRYDELIENEEALWSLLLFCGYLSLDDAQLSSVETHWNCKLRIPNQEVRALYNTILSKWLASKIGADNYHSFLMSLAEGRIEEFTTRLTNYLFACTSSHDFQAEADYHSFTLGLLASITDTHFLYSNKESGLGRPDCLLIPRDKTKAQGIILEFKHLHLPKKVDSRDIDMLKHEGASSAKGALEQIDARNYEAGFGQHTHITEVLRIGLVYSHRQISAAAQLVRLERRENELLGSSSEDDISYFHEIAKDTGSDEEASIFTPVVEERSAGKKRKRVIDSDSSEEESIKPQSKKRLKRGLSSKKSPTFFGSSKTEPVFSDSGSSEDPPMKPSNPK